MGLFWHTFSMILMIISLVESNSGAVKNLYFKKMDLENAQEKDIHEFRMLNRRHLIDCPLVNHFINVTTDFDVNPLKDEQNVVVTVSGVLHPLDHHWVAMVSPSHSSVKDCPLNGLLYKETGDFSDLPLLCHYPVKAAYLKNDPDFLTCKKNECKHTAADGSCLLSTCSASVTFHVINIRTDIQFVAFSNGFGAPCLLGRSQVLSFATPNRPLHGHISSIDSTGTSVKVRWVSGSNETQQVQYGNGKSNASLVTTFTQQDMCGSIVKSPAQDFGWHDPGYIHTSVMTGLQPSTKFTF